jgi:hypothetical protein
MKVVCSFFALLALAAPVFGVSFTVQPHGEECFLDTVTAGQPVAGS